MVIQALAQPYNNFNPRSPCGERPNGGSVTLISETFQSTLPVWGATFYVIDSFRFIPVFQSTLPVWGATGKAVVGIIRKQFQSTLPVWGATKRHFIRHSFNSDFNPRSPCGERRMCSEHIQRYLTISIHAPRVGSDKQQTTLHPP